MAEQKGIVVITGAGDGFVRVKSESDGRTYTLSLAENVQKFNPNGLMIDSTYYIMYDDESNMIYYAKPDKNSGGQQPYSNTYNKPASPRQGYNQRPSNNYNNNGNNNQGGYNKPQNNYSKPVKKDIGDSIIAQSCMKAVANYSNNLDDLKRNTEEMARWVKERYL